MVVVVLVGDVEGRVGVWDDAGHWRRIVLRALDIRHVECRAGAQLSQLSRSVRLKLLAERQRLRAAGVQRDTEI
jgi:hypothetical protein